MKIEQIAKLLNECGNKKHCKKCSYARDQKPTLTCEEQIIKYAATEIIQMTGDIKDEQTR